MTSFKWLTLALAAAAVSMSGCESRRDGGGVYDAAPETAAAGSRHPDAPLGIGWLDDVDAAFAQASVNGKPVFLYWGAVWCPYCADLKAHVFSRRDVQERLELFVPVYLDGDDPGAQKWAEEFEIAGYPTVLALAPDRTELARIAGGMDLAVYAEMLDLVLGDVRPLREVLESLEAGSTERLSRDDCRRLAYNGWGLDEFAAAEAASIAAALARGAERCPRDARVERARLTAIAASYAVDAEIERVLGGAAPSRLLATLVGRVRAVVADRELAVSAADALQYLGADFFTVARVLHPSDTTELREHWSAVMDAAAGDSRYTEGDRLAAVRSKVEAVKAFGVGGEIPADLAAQARGRVDTALARVRGTPAQPGVVNAAVNLLVALEDPARAYAVAEEAMQGAKTPYYYMADLAALDERMGRIESSVAWLERAYRESKGPATRFQWGTNYVRGLLRMKAGEADAVRDAAIAVLGELDGPGRIYRRSRARLESLDEDLRAWNAGGAHDAAIAAIRARMDEICGRIPADEPDALETCRNFL